MARISSRTVPASTQPPYCAISVALGTGSLPARTIEATVARTKAPRISGSWSSSAPGTRTRNSVIRDRPLLAMSRNTPAPRSPAPALAPIMIEATPPRPMSASIEPVKFFTPPAGP